MEWGTQATLGGGGNGDKHGGVHHLMVSTKRTGAGIDGGNLVGKMMLLGSLDLPLV